MKESTWREIAPEDRATPEYLGQFVPQRSM
jgi:hypothetical protein